MIDRAAIREIVNLYVKHGWLLRRVLLSASTKQSLKSASDLFGDIPVIDSDIDAAWFSRPPVGGGVAWEIRNLSASPYALLANIDEYDSGFQDALNAVEAQLRIASYAN